MSISALSSSSFKAPTLLQKRTFLDREGRDIPLNYEYKTIVTSSNIQILTPQELQTYVSGDKNVKFAQIQIYDPAGQLVQSNSQQIRITVINQRNTYGVDGLQTQIVGYCTFNPMLNYFLGDTMQFTVDSRQKIKLNFEYLDVTTNTWQPYNLSQPVLAQKQIPYIYYECYVEYDYNNL